MNNPKIFTVQGVNATYLLRRVQLLVSSNPELQEELPAALQECRTEEGLLDFFFTTDILVNEQFIRMFEKRLQELQCPF